MKRRTYMHYTRKERNKKRKNKILARDLGQSPPSRRRVSRASFAQSTTERTMHVHPVTKTVAMRANSLDVISLPTFF